MKNIYYLKHFQTWYSFWAVFFALLGSLFLLYKVDFDSMLAKEIFFSVYWIAIAISIFVGLLNGGLLRLVGIRMWESQNKKILNDNINTDGAISDSISNKELQRVHKALSREPLVLLERFFLLGVVAVVISSSTAVMIELPIFSILIIVITEIVMVTLLAFFGVLLSESLIAPIFRECREKIYHRGLEAREQRARLFSLKNRVNYFVFLFFVLMVIAVSGIEEVSLNLLGFSVLALMIIAITGKVLFSSIYLVFTEIESFASELPTASRTRHLTGSSFKEALDLSHKLNEAAEDLHQGRKKKEKEKEKVNAIINNFVGPIIFVDKDNRVGLFNSAAEKILKMTEKDYGKKISSSKGYDISSFKKVIHKKYELEEEKENEEQDTKEEEVVKVKYQKRQKVYKVKTSSVYDDNNDFYGVVKVFYDMTTEKAIDQAKSKFISVAAHQLRTPLSSIKWIVKMALDGDAGELNEEQKRLLHKAYNSNQRIIRLIDDLLNVSRIEEGKFGYQFQKEDLSELVEEKLEDFDHKVKKKSLDLRFNNPDNELPVYIDKEKVGLAVENIIDNAIKYTPEKGRVDINIKSENGMVELSVKDSGYGIPEKEQVKIFSKFFRASNVSKSEIGGSGLGLFIARNIIQGHGGDIDLKSEEGEGTEVTIELPVNKDN